MSRDQKALEELQERNLMTLPVTLINGQAIVGFDRARLATLLGIS